MGHMGLEKTDGQALSKLLFTSDNSIMTIIKDLIDSPSELSREDGLRIANTLNDFGTEVTSAGTTKLPPVIVNVAKSSFLKLMANTLLKSRTSTANHTVTFDDLKNMIKDQGNVNLFIYFYFILCIFFLIIHIISLIFF